ncbi:DUF47 domain-containing protein [Cellulomonas carbonis]|uniref:Phosphate transport regulator n=1 Tax=Cellulomonas carbonis T26 TaxID=947969 RepID=A0A0A0BSR7_9CELL|nr:DUF47 family protein [Cellulomonas carbonis]KGM11488.1 phosphate transport regulator [Cellulomonas carbonis T26]GGC04224.1 phosphate transport regulator [Cellulomonas carbonis]
MRLRLSPRNESFFDLLTTTASQLVTGADLLGQVVEADPVRRPELAAALRDAEHAADESTHAFLRKLNTTFVTPFDRDDLYALASGLDDCMDHMEEAADLIVLYRIGALPELVRDQVEVLRQCAALTADAMPRLRSMKDLPEYWVEINRLENEADRLYRRLIADLFHNGTDAVEIMKLKEVVTALEDAADAFEGLANHVETVALKES